MVDSPSGTEFIFLPYKRLIKCGSDINVCYNYYLFSSIGPADVEKCTPLGSAPLPVFGRGVVKICKGHYMDHNGLSHPIALEVEIIY